MHCTCNSITHFLLNHVLYMYVPISPLSPAISSSILSDINRFSREKLNSGIQELSHNSTGQRLQEKRWQEKILFSVKTLCLTTRLMVWSTVREEGMRTAVNAIQCMFHSVHCEISKLW